MEKKQYLTVSEVAELTGLSNITIGLYCRKGRIKAIQPGGATCKWLIEADEVERLLTPVRDQT